jgi:hypothetical protein
MLKEVEAQMYRCAASYVSGSDEELAMARQRRLRVAESEEEA